MTNDEREFTLDVTAGAAGLVSHAGGALLPRVADRLGLMRALSLRLADLEARARVTPRGRDSRVIRVAGRRWPDRVIVLDWAAASGRHRGWLAPDGVHLGGPSGERAFTRLLAQVVPLADDPPVP